MKTQGTRNATISWDHLKQDLEQFALFGVPAQDDKGHSVNVNYRVRQAHIDILEEVREKAPKGWFKTKASLHRSILCIGTWVILHLLDEDYNTELNIGELKKRLEIMNKLAKKERVAQLYKDLAKLESNINDSNITNKEEAIAAIWENKAEIGRILSNG